LAGKKRFRGYLDRLRENLDVLDEQIENARALSKKKPKRGASDQDSRQQTKVLRDLIELRNETLDRIKAHLLGRDQTGAIVEPEDAWDHNQQVEFERYFKNQLSPWTENDLKMKCEDCGVESEEVSACDFEQGDKDETYDLCDKCHVKRQTANEKRLKESEESDAEDNDAEGDGVDDNDTEEFAEPAS
jgi:hypothetical protein